MTDARRTNRLSIARSTPFRLTIILIGVFTASTLFSFWAAFVYSRNAADVALQIQVTQEFNSYALSTDQKDLEQRVLTQIATVPAKSLILIYIADGGRRISNVTNFPLVEDFSIVDAPQIRMDPALLADSYLAVSGRAGQGAIILARSRDQVSELSELFTTIFLISLLPTLTIAMTAGFVIARNARSRVEKIRTSLAAMTDGRLDTRVPDFAGPQDDLSEIGDAVNSMAAAQSAQVATLRQISADIAHDLKTPIQRVSVLLERLDQTTSLSDVQREIVDQARGETHQIVHTFQSLLQIAQLEGGAVKAHFTPVDLQAVASGIVDIYEPDADQTGHELTFAAIGPGPFEVNGDRNLLGQIVANLIENALRHTPRGSAIRVTLALAAGRVTLSCCDTGPGIPEEERDHVLRRLYRLERSRTSEGSGLGLSLVAAISDLHDADLQLGDNAPGLCVTVSLPALAPARPSPR